MQNDQEVIWNRTHMQSVWWPRKPKIKKTFEEILDEAAEKAAKEYKELPPDPLEHPELYSR